MKSTNYVVFSLLILAAVVPEIISGSAVSAESNLKSSVRQTVGCTGRCFRLRSRAVQDCRNGIIAGNVCIVRNGCNPGVPNGGYECIFISTGTPSPPTLPPLGDPCPNNCFVPSIASAGAIQGAQASATQDCAGRFPTCLVRPCSATPLNGFICARPCPNICRTSVALANQDCTSAVRCTVQPCTLPSGALGSSCGTPTALIGTAPMGSSPSASPTMTPGASPSVTPTPAASPSVTPTTTPTPTVTVSATPSPSCTLTSGAIGAVPAPAICMCGSSSATLTILASVDDAGGAITVPNEVTGQTGYTNCVRTALDPLCSPDRFSTFVSRGGTDVNNCCTANVVDGMGINTATNQCRIGNGCAPIEIPSVTALLAATPMVSCVCSGMTMTVAIAQIVDMANNNAPFAMTTTAQTTAVEAYGACLVTMISPLCSSTGFPTFTAMAAMAVETCCGDPGVGGTFAAGPPPLCAIP